MEIHERRTSDETSTFTEIYEHRETKKTYERRKSTKSIRKSIHLRKLTNIEHRRTSMQV